MTKDLDLNEPDFSIFSGLKFWISLSAGTQI